MHAGGVDAALLTPHTPWDPNANETLFTEELPWLHGHDLELVMGRAVCDWLGWKR